MFKVGDRVRVREGLKNATGYHVGGLYVNKEMAELAGRTFTIEHSWSGALHNNMLYCIKGIRHIFSGAMLEPAKETMYLVAVKHNHKGAWSKTYWFLAKESIAKDLKVERWVLVDTMYGPQTAVVAHLPVKIARGEDLDTCKEILEIQGEFKDVISVLGTSVLDYEKLDEPPF